MTVSFTLPLVANNLLLAQSVPLFNCSPTIKQYTHQGFVFHQLRQIFNLQNFYLCWRIYLHNIINTMYIKDTFNISYSNITSTSYSHDNNRGRFMEYFMMQHFVSNISILFLELYIPIYILQKCLHNQLLAYVEITSQLRQREVT